MDVWRPLVLIAALFRRSSSKKRLDQAPIPGDPTEWASNGLMERAVVDDELTECSEDPPTSIRTY